MMTTAANQRSNGPPGMAGILQKQPASNAYSPLAGSASGPPGSTTGPPGTSALPDSSHPAAAAPGPPGAAKTARDAPVFSPRNRN
ncbi:MAG TPA: hypothetical protein VG052_12320, partial [Puia sp.]|nr:hypothetical protein [Puia sp.]